MYRMKNRLLALLLALLTAFAFLPAAMAAEDVLNRTAAAADMPEVGTFIF